MILGLAVANRKYIFQVLETAPASYRPRLGKSLSPKTAFKWASTIGMALAKEISAAHRGQREPSNRPALDDSRLPGKVTTNGRGVLTGLRRSAVQPDDSDIKTSSGGRGSLQDLASRYRPRAGSVRPPLWIRFD